MHAFVGGMGESVGALSGGMGEPVGALSRLFMGEPAGVLGCTGCTGESVVALSWLYGRASECLDIWESQ